MLRYFNTQELSFHSRTIGQQYRTFGTRLFKADNELSWRYWGLVPESALLGGDGRECLAVYRKLCTGIHVPHLSNDLCFGVPYSMMLSIRASWAVPANSIRNELTKYTGPGSDHRLTKRVLFMVGLTTHLGVPSTCHTALSLFCFSLEQSASDMISLTWTYVQGTTVSSASHMLLGTWPRWGSPRDPMMADDD